MPPSLTPPCKALAQRGLQLSDDQPSSTVLPQASWPGRFEILQRHPPVVVDSAHNRNSAIKLRQALG